MFQPARSAFSQSFLLSMLTTGLSLGSQQAHAYNLALSQKIPISFAQDSLATDIDNDGDLDIVIAVKHNLLANRILINNGIGYFTLSRTSINSHDSVAVRSADIDKDGDQDLLFANQIYGGVELWINDSFGQFFKSQQRFNNNFVSPSPSNQPRKSLAVHDMAHSLSVTGIETTLTPNSTTPDFLSAPPPQSSRYRDGISEAHAINNPIKPSSSDILNHDLNQDGYQDLVIANSNGPNEVWLNDGAGRFYDSQQRLGNGNTSAIALIDFNEDNLPDLVFANQKGRYTTDTRSQIWINNGHGIFRLGKEFSTQNALDVVVGPLNNHNSQNVLLANNYNAYSNAQSQHFVVNKTKLLPAKLPVGAYDTAHRVTISDLNGDGYQDVLFGYFGGAPLTVLMNQGKGDFTHYTLPNTNIETSSILCADFNMDGINDVFITSPYKPSLLYLGQPKCKSNSNCLRLEPPEEKQIQQKAPNTR